MKKILHISSELKFSLNAYRIYEKAFPGQNKLLITHPFWPRLKKNTSEDVDIEYMCTHFFHLKMKKIANSYDVVVLHSMNYWNTLFFLNNTNANTKIIPCLFGFEIDTNEYIKSEAYQEYESHLVNDSFVRRVYRFLNWGIYHSQKQINLNFVKFLSQTNILCTWEKQFKFLIENKYISSNTYFFGFKYFPLEQMIKGIDLSIEVGENILIGHSGDPTSNQIETLKELKALDLGVRKLITPLSYGSKPHIAKVKSYGEKNLPTNFKAIQDLMPLEEYNKLLQSCGYVLMNQKTTTGFGNILTSLFLGSKVFVHCEIIYEELKSWGIIVYNIEDFLDKRTEPFNSEDVQLNRKVLTSNIGEEALLKKIKNLIFLN
jgi:dTDP-N-acetylfucosamine:lipid II N-acetylfucosaminyltransferase